MDPNPSRNRKLPTTPAPTENTPEKAPHSASDAPAEESGAGSPLRSPGTRGGLSYLNIDNTAITINGIAFPGSITMATVPPKPNFAAVAAREQYTSWAVNISAYATINGRLYTKTMQTDRYLWDALDPRVRDMQVQKLKRELAVEIVEKLIEIYVDGQPWNPPADQKAP